MVNRYAADLHVHTVLSPCAAVEMIPPLIVQQACEQGINLIAITDHNSTANFASVQKAAHSTNLIVLPGMELQTREEVHVLCLFDTLEQVSTWQLFVDQHLPSIENHPDIFGAQYIVDETGDFIREEERLLSVSSTLSMKDAWQKVSDLGGLFIPAHINRQLFGLISILGFVPADIDIEALEISRHITPQKALLTFPQISKYPLIQSGDVHTLDGFLGSTIFTLQKPTISEIRLALNNREGRSTQILG